jgi:hypothetical protein
MRGLRAAPVAQRIESRTSNPKVAGSNPAGRALTARTYDESTTHQPPLAHILPTSLPPDLAEVLDKWATLPSQEATGQASWGAVLAPGRYRRAIAYAIRLANDNKPGNAPEIPS